MPSLLRAILGAAVLSLLLSLLVITACGSEEAGETPTEATTPAPQGFGISTPGGDQNQATPDGVATPTPEASVTPTPQGGAIEMGIDPETSGNTATTLGTLESCVRVDVPNPAFDGVSDYSIDVYVKGDTQAPLAYDAGVIFDATKVHVTQWDARIKLPGAIDLSNHDYVGGFWASAVGGPGIAGDGALARLGLDIGGSGVVTFDFAPEPVAADYASAVGEHLVTRKSAQLAINEDCPR